MELLPLSHAGVVLCVTSEGSGEMLKPEFPGRETCTPSHAGMVLCIIAEGSVEMLKPEFPCRGLSAPSHAGMVLLHCF